VLPPNFSIEFGADQTLRWSLFNTYAPVRRTTLPGRWKRCQHMVTTCVGTKLEVKHSTALSLIWGDKGLPCAVLPLYFGWKAVPAIVGKLETLSFRLYLRCCRRKMLTYRKSAPLFRLLVPCSRTKILIFQGFR